MSEPISKIGLRKYLNRTKAQHDNRDYDDFVWLYSTHQSISGMARAFKVDRGTMKKYRTIYEQEQGASV